MSDAVKIMQARLPAGIRSEYVDNGNGLRAHVLCAGENTPDKPLAMLLHGFPELAFSWRHIMLPLVEAGYFVIAPDQRGYGFTIDTAMQSAPGPVGYDTPLQSWSLLNMVRDALGVVDAFDRTRVDLLVGHDFGSPVAAWAGLVRPDVFTRVALMSAPFGGPPALPGVQARSGLAGIDPKALEKLTPARKHYQWYYATEPANRDIMTAPDGLQQFLRDYYHAKSADWAGNAPHPLEPGSPAALAVMPHYYIMELDQTMPEAVAASRPDAEAVKQCRWMPDADMNVYAQIYQQTGFQGGLQSYRCGTSGQFTRDYQLFASRTMDQPVCFIAGAQDWGVYQKPGDLQRMESTICTQYLGTHLIDGAGHWVQQEQPEAVVEKLLAFAAVTR